MTPRQPRAPRIALLVAALAFPALAVAQGGPPPGDGNGPPTEVRERIERRIRLARSLGLAEALDLDEAGTVRMNATMAPFDARRKVLLEGIRANVRTLRQAATQGDPKALSAVDASVQRLFDARASMLALDREMFAALSKGMPPEQVARMALFFARFRQRFGMEMPDSRGPGQR